MSIDAKRGETQGSYLTIVRQTPSLDPIGLCCGVTGTLVCFLCLGLVPLRNKTHILKGMANRTLCREQLA